MDRLWFAPGVQASAELGRCAGVVIGRHNRQVNTSQVRVRSVDVDGVVATLREQAVDAAEVRRLDSEYTRLNALLGGPAAGTPADLAAVGLEAVANRERYVEIQERRLARLDDDAALTRGDRAEVSRQLHAARKAVTDLTESIAVWRAEVGDLASVSEPSKGILHRIAEALGLLQPAAPHAGIADPHVAIPGPATPPAIDRTVAALGVDGPELAVPWLSTAEPSFGPSRRLAGLSDMTERTDQVVDDIRSVPGRRGIVPPSLRDRSLRDDLDGIGGIGGIGGF
ncbi:hypothetical protein Ga0074812_109115 [Parafrankia irregularis]|uniref:Uncharacterized protein n=1 Tax=Parafrankia irregularis TaxID=795642 RepID=A0A0S4QP75_9ACTN|nr:MULTISPECIES: hypothetical protein [Parafrankia]MBE3200563.1 hypothetical protein [Parafrankia sp. CH37]CUU56895.1 hypothetical protein Ga0074812_109115 [Parafrankia irregularis]